MKGLRVVGLYFVVLVAWSTLGVAEPYKVVPPGATVDGRTIAEFAAEWWKWSQAVPDAEDPVRDESGRHCAVGQSGPVWFLAGAYDSSRKRRACEVPAGKYIFFPVINSVAWPRSQDKNFSCEEAKRKASVADEHEVELLVEIDGSNLDDVGRFRARTEKCFNVYERLPTGAYDAYPSATDGYWIMLEPLPAGRHSIKFSGRHTDRRKRRGEMIQDIQYDLTIR